MSPPPGTGETGLPPEVPGSRRRPLSGYALNAPASWAALPLEPEPEWEDAVVAALSPLPEAEPALRHDLAAVHPPLAGEPHLAIGVWMPDPDTGSITGAMTIDLLVPEDGQEAVDLANYEHLLTTVRRRHLKVVTRDLTRAVVPAGPALVVRELVIPKGSVSEYRVIYTVFPETSTEAVELSFVTPHLGLAAQLDEESDLIAEHLVLQVSTP